MAIAKRLQWYLDAAGVDYEVLPHPRSWTSAQTARRSRVPLRCLAKPVLLEDEYGWTEVQIRGFLGENLMRVYQANWK